VRRLSGLDALLAPYSSALGTASGSYDMSSDPIYGPLFGGGSDALDALAALSGIRGRTGGSSQGGTTSSGVAGTTVTGGPTQYPYTAYDRPYTGIPEMIRRWGISLQPGAMRSLIEIARASGVLPGAREINKILQGYRSHEQQAYADRTNPNATSQYNSYHEQGLAIDAGWWSAHPELAAALAAAGWNQFSPSGEPWHYSYGVTG